LYLKKFFTINVLSDEVCTLPVIAKPQRHKSKVREDSRDFEKVIILFLARVEFSRINFYKIFHIASIKQA